MASCVSHGAGSMYDAGMVLGRPVFVLACLLGGGAAAAADADASALSARLVYERTPAAGACPDEAKLRAEVVRRVGRDPFDERAARLIVCRVERSGRGLRARIETATGAPGGNPTRELVSHRLDCQDLAEAVAVALSIAIDPVSAPAPTPTPSSAPSPAAVAPSAVAPAPPTPPSPIGPVVSPRPAAVAIAPTAPSPAPKAHGVELRLAVDGVLAVGLVPDAGYGGDLAIGVAGRRYAAEVDVRVVAPSSRTAGRGTLEVWQWAVMVAPCARGHYLAACLLGSAGIIYGSGKGLVISEQAQSPQVAAGARATAELPLTRERLRLRANLDLTAALTRTHFTLGGVEAWTSPRMAAALGLGVVGIFF